MQESNPVMQKLNHLAMKWQMAKTNKSLRLVKFLLEDDEQDMYDAFCKYTLGIDSDFEDIPFLFETTITSDKTYSDELIEELKEIVNEWNNANKPEGLDDTPILFEVDNTHIKSKNKAAHFLHNFQKLITQFNLPKGLDGVAIFIDHYSNPSLLQSWLEEALKFIKEESNCKIIIADSKTSPNFDYLDILFGEQVKTIVCNFEVNKIIQDISKMSDPKDPGHSYRIEFMKMFDAIQKREANLAKQHGEKCIELATALLEKDPYWITQIVTVNFALCNDQIGYKYYKEAQTFATKAVDNAQLSLGYLEPEMAKRLVGQTYLNRASIYTILKKHDKALADAQQAKKSYLEVNDQIMTLESCRMCMYTAIQISDDQTAAANMEEAFLLAENMDSALVKSSSFSLVAYELLNRSSNVITSQMEQLFEKVYGTNWKLYIENIYNPEKLATLEQE